MRKQRGFNLIELSIVLLISSIIFTASLLQKQRERNDTLYKDAGKQVAVYMQALAKYMSDNANTFNNASFAGLSFSGINSFNFLKSTTCGGTSTTAYLSCNFPSFPFHLSPTVSIVYPSGGPYATATVDFGQLIQAGAQPNPTAAAKVINSVRNEAATQRASYISPQQTSVAGHVIVKIDLTQTDTYVRTDGSNFNINGTGFFNNDEWSVIARDGAGAYNTAPASAAGSLYVNDIYLRSAGVWASDIYSLAKDNYKTSNEALLKSNEAIRFETRVSDGDVINQPTCPTGYIPQIFVSQASAITQTSNALAIVAFDAQATSINSNTQWRIGLRVLDTNGTWYNITSDKGYATARVKCTKN